MGQAESVEAKAPEKAPSQWGEGGQRPPAALVVVGPSGVGKGTLINKLMQSSDRFGFSCSHTTRPPREGEQDGVHYHFTTREAFEAEIAEDKFLEFARVHSNIYGTSVRAVRDVAAAGKCCVLDIDVQGARQVRAAGLPAVFVFIAPPSLAELERRLRGRNTESEEQVTTRLRTAREEMDSVDEPGLYDYVLVNDDFETTYLEFQRVADLALAGQVGGPLTATPAPAAPSLAAADEEAAEAAGVAAAGGPASVSEALGLGRWRGKVAVVTGAGSGIGWAVSESLAAAGLRVVAVSRRKERLEALQVAVVSEGGVPPGEFLPIVCDITKEAEVIALPRIIAKRWPGAGVDCLVNAAGVAAPQGGLMAGSTASWVEMVSTNVLGAAMVTREAVQDMARRGAWGHVVNVSCLEGHAAAAGGGGGGAGAGGGFYAATKHALHAMTDGLRQEARAKGVPLRVSSVSPGAVDTALDAGRRSSTSGRQAAPSAVPPAVLQPEDVVRAVLWCLGAPDSVETGDVVLRATGAPPLP